MRCTECGQEFLGEGYHCPECVANHQPDREISRRKFLMGATLAVGGLVGVGYLGAAFRLLAPPAEAAGKWQDVGPLTSFAFGNYQLITYNGQGYPDGVFVMNKGNNHVHTLDIHCAHLQCPVLWIYGDKPFTGNFACPCHGSTYDVWGHHTGGPAPHGLWTHYAKLQNGHVLIGGIGPWV